MNVTDGEQVGDWLASQVDGHSGSIFIEEGDQHLSYGQVEGMVAARARRLGDRSGTQVVVRPRLEADAVVELLAASRSGAVVVVIGPDRPDGEDLAQRAAGDIRPAHTILFTSGSTGSPKGVRIASRNWEAAAEASSTHLGHGVGDRWLCPLPLYHMSGLGALYRVLITGGTLVLAPDLEQLSLRMPGAQWASLVPTQVHRLLAQGGSLQVGTKILVGGGPAPPGLLESALQAGLTILPTYGMTETTGQVATALTPGGPLRPLPGVEVAIGEGGRIGIGGPTVMLGYVGEAEEEGWFQTLDRGRFGPDGSLLIEGRADRVIITGGEKVDPDRIAAILVEHPLIDEAFVYGQPDPEWGEVVVATYVGRAEPADLIAEEFPVLPRHARPRSWRRVSHLPRNELGKVDLEALQRLIDQEVIRHPDAGSV